MRKFLVSVLMITLLLLPGCGEREKRLESGFETFRETLTVAESLTAKVELTVSSGATAANYTMAVAYDGRRTEMTLLAPEILAGITAAAELGQTSIAWENVRLGAGPLDADGLTPVSAVPAMLEAMQSGYVELLWWEEEYIAARLHIGETSVLTLWLEEKTLTPVSAEISSGGLAVLCCDITAWEIG